MHGLRRLYDVCAGVVSVGCYPRQQQEIDAVGLRTGSKSKAAVWQQ